MSEDIESSSQEPAPPDSTSETPPQEHAAAPPPEDKEDKEEDHKDEKKKETKKRWRREPGLALSFRKGLPVEGLVERVIRGGYEIKVGKARGFCPHSQMDLRHVEDPEQHVGRTYAFKAMQLRRGGEEVILSRRALLDDERSEEAKAVRATLVEGAVTQGHVARLTDFGVFVDLGAGVTGLVHVSEVAHGRVARVEDVMHPGDTVRVKVLKLDEESGRISLSIRQATDDPWKGIAERFRSGQVVPGTLRRLAQFGAFIELEPGIEALAPADGFPPDPGGWQTGLESGQSAHWRVTSVDSPRRRISVQPVREGEAEPGAALEPGAKLKGRVQRVEKFGVFVWIGPGRVGLMPGIHTGTRKGTDLARAFPVGKELEIEVIEADPDGRRIRLSVPGAAQMSAPTRSEPMPGRRERERAPVREKETAPPAPASGFGTSLGDALREAFKKSADR